MSKAAEELGAGGELPTSGPPSGPRARGQLPSPLMPERGAKGGSGFVSNTVRYRGACPPQAEHKCGPHGRGRNARR